MSFGGSSGGGSQNNVTVWGDSVPSWALPSPGDPGYVTGTPASTVRAGHTLKYLKKAYDTWQDWTADYFNERYGDVTYAPRSTEEETALAAIDTRARNSDPIITDGETFLQAILSGEDYDINDKIAPLYTAKAGRLIDIFKEQALPQIHRNFNATGNYGSFSHHRAMVFAAEQLMQALAELGKDSFYNNYTFERGLQVEAVGSAIQYGVQDAKNWELLLYKGQLERDYQQGYLDSLYKQWVSDKEFRIKGNEILGNAVRTLTGAQSVSTAPYYRGSETARLAGAAMVGLGIYKQYMNAGSGIDNAKVEVAPWSEVYASSLKSANPVSMDNPALTYTPTQPSYSLGVS